MKNSILALLFFLSVIPVLAFSQPSFEGKPGHERFMSKMNLTDAQKEQFKKIRFDTEKMNIDIRAKLETTRLDLRRLFDSETIDRSAVEKKINEVSSLEASIKINQFNAWADCNKILTVDQQKIWKKALLMNQMMKKQMIKHGMMNRPSGPGNRQAQ